MADKTKILQWNCRSARQNFPYLVNFLTSNDNYEILCIQSLNCKPSAIPKLSGYCYPPFYKTDTAGRVGVATYVTPNVIVSAVETVPIIGATSIVTEIIYKHKKLKIANIYIPRLDPSASWIEAVSSPDCSWIITGDFNVRSELWEFDCPSGVEHARTRNKIIESDLVLLNDGTLTRIPDRSDQRGSALDLTLVTPDLAGRIGWKVEDDPLSSDHLPITIELQTTIKKEIPVTKEAKYNYKKANWPLFKDMLNQMPRIDTSEKTIDEHADELTKQILEAANLAIPKSNPNKTYKNNNPWWNEHCSEAVKKKKYTYNKYKKINSQANQEAMVQAKISCKKNSSRIQARTLD